jgi:hypothetical protein
MDLLENKGRLSEIPAALYAIAILSFIGAFIWIRATRLGQGTYGYGLDDAYIHMAMAKNFARSGVWGVSPYEAVAASSSPGWLLVLSLFFKLFGPQEWIPLAINLAAAVSLAFILDQLIAPYATEKWVRTLWTSGIMLALPLPTFVAFGMEHTLQFVLVAGYFAFGRKMATADYRLTTKECLILTGLACCMVLVRVEDAIFLPLPAIWSLFKRDIRPAVASALGPAGALGIYAVIARSQGFGLEPTSMMVKRTHLISAGGSALGGLFSKAWANWADYPFLVPFFLFLVVLLVGFTLKPKGRGPQICMLATAVFAFVVHSLNGSFGWYYRYEGYLLLFGLLAITCAAASIGAPERRRFATWGLALAGLFFLLPRAYAATEEAPELMMNIGCQQVQMGLFINQFYPGRNVLLNDIGGPSYYADFHLTDLVGLGTQEVALAKMQHRYNAAYLSGLFRKRKIDIGIVYRDWLPPSTTPYPLVPVGTWSLPSRYVQVEQRVLFVAGNEREATVLRRRMRAFEARLPKVVQVTYAR